MHFIWRCIRNLDERTVRNYPGALRAIAAGAATDDVVAAMRASSYEMAFELLYLLTGEHSDPDQNADGRRHGWALVPVQFAGGGTPMTVGDPDDLAMLFESLLTADPTGQEGSDFLT